jgi:hypothetical protein
MFVSRRFGISARTWLNARVGAVVVNTTTCKLHETRMHVCGECERPSRSADSGAERVMREGLGGWLWSLSS